VEVGGIEKMRWWTKVCLASNDFVVVVVVVVDRKSRNVSGNASLGVVDLLVVESDFDSDFAMENVPESAQGTERA